MVKQVIVMRKDLQMTKGKMVAQGSHASLAVILKMFRSNKSIDEFHPEIDNGKYELSLEVNEGSELDEWLKDGFTKICLYVNSENELLDIYNKAEQSKLPVALIVDGGATMFKGVKTITCLAIGPAKSEEIDKITGNLKLL
ncbi:aminoacyl-tRNA hydrolase [Clostridium sp. JS66]|uniref:aminoacyl-tRNA hydrolase n=1 Tax=Clostridium sp. JS66 TaxID=3064705 RepID=UPI00298E1227|nr:aminoacyl-tRNA hydrolase [Clostridium sp. JS66]WPC42830.1 aminoacyl-tRNA hydrolase [Clostridium sp. JS66]